MPLDSREFQISLQQLLRYFRTRREHWHAVYQVL